MYLCDGEVPYVCMESGSPFHEYASSMLQCALSSGTKADGLYTYCNDKRLNVELNRLSMKPAEYMVAQVKQPRMEHVKAVGGTKRSLLIGLVISIVNSKLVPLSELWELMDSYGLRRQFEELLVAAPAPTFSAKKRTEKASKASSNGWEGKWKDDWGSGEWEDWGKWKDKSSGYDNSYGSYGSYSKYSYDYKDWSKASRSRSAPRGDSFKPAQSQRSASQGTERSHKSAKFSRSVHADGEEPKGEKGGDETETWKEPTKKKPRTEIQAPERPEREVSGASLFKEAIATLPETVYGHDDRHDDREAPWIGGPPGPGGPGARRREGRTNGRSTPEVSDKPLEGKNSDVERPFMRFDGSPRAEDVRPLPVLREAFSRAKERWESSRDWSYVGEMLRSIRQDLTIQMVQDAFVVEVHEYWAQVALEFGDFKQFDQAAAQLEVYYVDPTLESGAGKVQEVLAWRLLYFTLEGEGLATTEFLRRFWGRLDNSPVVKFARRLRRVMSQRCFSQAIKLLSTNPEDVPALPQSLRNELLRRARLLQLMGLCKALKDRLTKETLESFGLAQDDEDKATTLPIVYMKDECQIDAQATHEQAAKELEPTALRSATPGQVRIKRRLGRQHEDHLNGFMRAPPVREISAPKEKEKTKVTKPRMVD